MRPLVRTGALVAGLAVLGLLGAPQTRLHEEEEGAKVRCGNLIYAGNKSSVCFSDRFLRRLELETNVRTDSGFTPVRLDSDELFDYPFVVMTGEGGFTLTAQERLNLRYFVTNGGFLLASAGCSDPTWARCFRQEMGRIFPQQKLKALPLTHAIYRTIYTISSTATAHDRKGATLEGLTHNGKIVVLFSSDGLNDTAHAKNCCCCGGDELDQAEFINANVLAYALLH